VAVIDSERKEKEKRARASQQLLADPLRFFHRNEKTTAKCSSLDMLK